MRFMPGIIYAQQTRASSQFLRPRCDIAATLVTLRAAVTFGTDDDHELPPRLSRRQLRGCVQARDSDRAHRVAQGQADAIPLPRHARRCWQVRLARRTGAQDARARGRRATPAQCGAPARSTAHLSEPGTRAEFRKRYT